MRSDFIRARLKPLALFARRLKYKWGARVQNYLFPSCMCFNQWRHTPDYPGDTFGLYAFQNQGGKASSELFHRWYYSLLGGLELLIQPSLTSDAFAGLYISSLMRNISGQICTNGQIECLSLFLRIFLPKLTWWVQDFQCDASVTVRLWQTVWSVETLGPWKGSCWWPWWFCSQPVSL